MLNVQVSLLMFHEMRAVMKCIVHSGGNLQTVDYTIQQSWQYCMASSARYVCAVILTALHHFYIITVQYQSAVNTLKVTKVEHTTSRQQLLLFNTVSLVVAGKVLSQQLCLLPSQKLTSDFVVVRTISALLVASSTKTRVLVDLNLLFLVLRI